MNGLGDPRLTLQRHELAADGRARVTAGHRGGVPGESRWALFWRRLTTRRALLELDDGQLQDIGLTREQARAEALLPFWRL
ncbi:MAG TPA: DUF1127 domain-containing protein [Pseudomonas sp.]|nr:DUF1127 domain-containing protein [Pseudomonas sp.]